MKRIFRYKVYRRLILVYFALIILTVAVLSFFLYGGFSSNYTETIKANHHNVMQQTLLSIAALSEQLDNYMTHIVTMQDAAFILYGNATDYLKCYQFYLGVKELCSLESFFRSIIIYNGMTDHILSNGEYPSNLLQILKSNDYRRSRKLYYIEHEKKNKGSEPVYAIVADPAIFGNVEKTSAVVFFLDKGYMDNRLKALCMPSQNLMVIADDGRIVSHSNPALDYYSYGETELYRTLTTQTQSEGSFQLIEDEEVVQVFYSRLNLFGWTIVSETPLNELTSRMSTTRRQIVIASTVLASCGCVIGMLLLRRLYFEPVIGLLSGIEEYDSRSSINEFQLAREAYTRLQDEMSTLRVNAKATISMLQKNYAYALMHGGQSIANELMGSLSEVDAMIKGPYYCVCLFELEASTREDGSEDYFLDLIETAFPQYTHAALIDWNGTIATMLLQYNDHAAVKEIYSALDSFLEKIKGENIHCSVAVDPDCSDNSHLSESYKYCEQALLYRFFKGWDSVISAENIQQWNQRQCDYPSQEENAIQHAIQTGNIQEIDESIEKIEQKLREQSYDCVMGHLKRLFANILGQEYVLFENDTFNSTLIELSKSCKQLCTISNEQRSQRNQIVSAGIMTYIRDNLSNSNLSVQDVADYFGISASQVSRLLKIYQSTSFSTYLTQVRLDRACDLLKNQSESIIDISIACGFNTPNYFSTIFKKHFGVSPRMYQQLSGDLRPRVDSHI